MSNKTDLRQRETSLAVSSLVGSSEVWTALQNGPVARSGSRADEG